MQQALRPIGGNCLEEALGCGGKKLESCFWDQVSLMAGREGYWTGPPPASALGFNILTAVRDGGEPGPAAEGGAEGTALPLSGVGVLGWAGGAGQSVLLGLGPGEV